MSENTCRIVIKGASPQMELDQVLLNLEPIFKKSKEEIRLIVSSGYFVVNRGLDRISAREHFEVLKQSGCEVSIEEELPITIDETSPQRAGVYFQSASDLITARLGLERIEKFSVRSFFSAVFSHHDPTEVERSLAVGAPQTTPPISNAMGVMPNPWIFFRVLSGTILAYLIFLYGWETYRNLNLVPGLIIIGSFAVPFSVLILFFELNTPANISLIKIVKLVVIGGAISLLLSLFLFEATPFLGMFGASAAGVVEEVGKLGALLLALSAAERTKYKYRLNGLLLGAAIGTGFAAFESAGYALRYGISGAAEMVDIINFRGALSPFGHIAWTAIAASAFWVARPFHGDMFSTIRSVQFLRVFLIPVALHFIWNLPFQGPFMIKYAVLGFAAWVVVISLVQSGLKEMASCCSD